MACALAAQGLEATIGHVTGQNESFLRATRTGNMCTKHTSLFIM